MNNNLSQPIPKKKGSMKTIGLLVFFLVFILIVVYYVLTMKEVEQAKVDFPKLVFTNPPKKVVKNYVESTVKCPRGEVEYNGV